MPAWHAAPAMAALTRDSGASVFPAHAVAEAGAHGRGSLDLEGDSLLGGAGAAHARAPFSLSRSSAPSRGAQPASHDANAEGASLGHGSALLLRTLPASAHGEALPSASALSLSRVRAHNAHRCSRGSDTAFPCMYTGVKTATRSTARWSPTAQCSCFSA
jgi:hypothetical protein